MRVHFLHRHVRDTVVILEDGKISHPRCPRCDMLFPWRDLKGMHLATAQCTRGAERKRRQIAEEEFRERSERAFQAYGETLENVTAFRYLGRVITAGGYDWPAGVGNLQKARKSWGWLSRILIREGADPKVLGHF